MRHIEEIWDIAAERKGGRSAVLTDAPRVRSGDGLAKLPDRDWLAQMSRGIFSAGLAWTVVENKWPDILDAFKSFDIEACAHMSEDWFYELVEDIRVIRSPPKIRSVQQNAQWISGIAAANGSFGAYIAQWPAEDFVGLLAVLKKDGARLGGNTGAYMLRNMGVDSFILTKSVVGRLVAEGVVDKAPSSKKAMMSVQDAFNTWKSQSDFNLTQISRILAQSVD